MSNQTSKKSNEMVQLAAVLLIITAVVAGLLGLVNAVTEPVIAENNAAALQEALEALIPGAEFDDGTEADDPVVNAVYTAAGGEGYCVEVSPTGFGGKISMIVGINADGSIAGIEILSMSETPGLGAKASDDAFAGQFTGAAATGSLAVTKDGGSIEAITGATITSRAVADGVNAACNYVAALS